MSVAAPIQQIYWNVRVQMAHSIERKNFHLCSVGSKEKKLFQNIEALLVVFQIECQKVWASFMCLYVG